MNPSIMDSTSTSVRAIVFRSKAEVLTLYSCDPDAGLVFNPIAPLIRPQLLGWDSRTKQTDRKCR